MENIALIKDGNTTKRVKGNSRVEREEGVKGGKGELCREGGIKCGIHLLLYSLCHSFFFLR